MYYINRFYTYIFWDVESEKWRVKITKNSSKFLKEGILWKKELQVEKLMNFGRIVIPIDFRNELGINEKDTVNVYLKGSYIVIEKDE